MEKTEDGIQADCVTWFNNNYCLKTMKNRMLIYSVPNGGYRNPIEAKKLKLTGTLAGVADLHVILPNKVIFVEMKRSNGVLSDSQKDFKSRVNSLGFEYHVCWSFEDFKTLIEYQIEKLKLC